MTRLQQIAGRLLLSPRTLLRRLPEAGLCFCQLLGDIRPQRVLYGRRDPALNRAMHR
ncbi:MAG: hypothetical protein R3260_09270 [Pseudomonas sp.]|nr:hypothetical protein [Pseudomonas sp.]